MPAEGLGPYPVTGIVDGDTLTVNRDGKEITVRLIVVDTPETVDPDRPVQCFGPQAAARAADLLSGQQVWLQADASQPATDRSGRTLAYVWLPADQLINAQLIAEGYAREYTDDRPYHYRDAFRAAQAAAADAEQGLWSPATCGRCGPRPGRSSRRRGGPRSRVPGPGRPVVCMTHQSFGCL